MMRPEKPSHWYRPRLTTGAQPFRTYGTAAPSWSDPVRRAVAVPVRIGSPGARQCCCAHFDTGARFLFSGDHLVAHDDGIRERRRRPRWQEPIGAAGVRFDPDRREKCPPFDRGQRGTCSAQPGAKRIRRRGAHRDMIFRRRACRFFHVSQSTAAGRVGDRKATKPYKSGVFQHTATTRFRLSWRVDGPGGRSLT